MSGAPLVDGQPFEMKGGGNQKMWNSGPPPTPKDLITESGDTIITEAGDTLTTES